MFHVFRPHILARLVLIVSILFIGSAFAGNAMAAPLAQSAGEEAPWLSVLVADFLSLGGIAALFGLLTNVAKAAGWVKDGQAVQVTAVLNLLGMVGLGFARIFRPDLNIAGLDAIAGQVAAAGVILLGLVTQQMVSRATHSSVKGLPLVGTSFSLMLMKKT